MQESIVYTKNLYYILFKCYIKYKSEKHLYRACGGRDVMKFYSRWPARILFSASHSLCVYHSSPFCDHREKEREREKGGEREREPASAIDIWSTAALPGENRDMYFQKALARSWSTPSSVRELLFARGTFHPWLFTVWSYYFIRLNLNTSPPTIPWFGSLSRRETTWSRIGGVRCSSEESSAVARTLGKLVMARGYSRPPSIKRF